jgi:hypothetical protein
MAKQSIADLINDALAGGTDKDTVAQTIEELNSKYFIVNEHGKVLIYALRRDRDRTVYDRMIVPDLLLLYQNKPILLAAADGARVPTNPVTVWLNARTRKEFPGGIVFDPTGTAPADQLNLWKGFGFEPREGDWSLLKDHILNIVCAGHQDQYDYLLSWLAYTIQRRANQGEVAVIMRGGEGCGKGILARAMKILFGQHGLQISHAKHLVGNFNIHLRDCVLLFADEAFFAGDKQHVGVLKALITEPTITIEGKYLNAVESPNYIHLMMASNESWVVPAALDARRFFVLNVLPDRIGDTAYFDAIAEQLENGGGYAAILHELLARDLSDFNVRVVPQTEGLQDQKKLSLDCQHAWWMEVLHRGYVYQSSCGDQWFTEWHDRVATDLLYASYFPAQNSNLELTRDRLEATQ